MHGLPLDFRDTAGNAENDLREWKPAAAALANEVPQHLLGRLKVRNHPVPEWTDRPDRGRRPADHPARVGSDGLHLAAQLIDSDDGGLEDDDPLAANEDERVRGAEIDRELAPCE